MLFKRLKDRQKGVGRHVVAALAVACSSILSLACPAWGAAPPEVFRIPSDDSTRGTAAGELSNPLDVAASPLTGHLYVSDLGNSRIAEYTAWGTFVRAWGWDVAPDDAPGDTATDQFEICTSECQAGDEGSGAGQLVGPRGITVDAAGNVYVFERSFGFDVDVRVQKFSATGEWLLMFGGEVNKTTNADLCTADDVQGGDTCGAGVPGTADGWFSNFARFSYIAYGPATDTIFVGDVGRIQEFDTDGNFVRDIPLPGDLAGKIVGGLEVDVEGNFYVITQFNGSEAEEDVHKLDPTGKEVQKFEVPLPESVAVDVQGNVYVVNDGEAHAGEATGDKETRKYHPDGSLDWTIPGDPGVNLRTVATNICSDSPPPGNVYTVNFGSGLAYVKAYGSAPTGCEPPPPVPPQIVSQYATTVDSREATVRAEIDPSFFADTTYYVQYGTAPCSAGGCAETPPATLTDKLTNIAVRTAGVVLTGLEPNTPYYFRFVTQSSGGGPVFGAERTFTTFPVDPGPVPPCGNAAFRVGAGALLPDCRAYEMVSPIDKNNGDIVSSFTGGAEPTTLYQSAELGNRFTYSSSRSFADPEGAPYTSQYLASRGGEGWMSESISPSRTRVSLLFDFQRNAFKAFSADLCMAWLRSDADAPLAAGATPEFSNVYRRQSCGSVGYETLSTAGPSDRLPVYQDNEQRLWMELQGTSTDGSRAIFIANDNLEGTAAPDVAESTESDADSTQLYEHSKVDGLRFVCILPSGNPLKEACAAGLATRLGDVVSHLRANVDNAISTDGSRIFWTAAKDIGPGRIYARIDGTTTVAISVPVSPEPALWWGAAEDGSVAVFSFAAGAHADELYAFEVDTKTPQLIAQEVLSVMGMSDDASRIYFASTKDLGGGATEGQPNVYLWDGGSTEFIATLPASELADLSPIAARPDIRTSRITPDGRYVAFSSRGSLTGFDNTDASTGQPDTEVFLYDAVADLLTCLSCNPTGARPTGKNGIAAMIPPWERSLYASRALSDDGRRVFFEAYDRLTPRDENGAKDVYQWEAEGTGTCDAADSSFQAASGGCVELISSGQSARESVFLDAAPSGSDVFITTLSSLVPWDPDAVDVYDARVGGGFPPPPPPRDPCEGGACQSPPPPAAAPSVATAVTRPGNPVFKKRCRKGQRRVRRKGKVVCVKKRRADKQAKRRRARR